MREATIQKILSVEAIPNSDNLEKIKVLGWEVVALKGEFKPGDLCVYCEIDSLMPDRPEFEFLRPKKFRIKTIKLRGQLSQGIVFPLSIIGKSSSDNLEVGMDVSDIIGVKHYEKEIPLTMRGMIRGGFPGYVPQTDEPKIQNIPEVINELKGIPCVATVKLDGTSASYIFKDNDFHICSRNNSFKLDIPENDKVVYCIIEKKYDIRKKMTEVGTNIAIQGEIVGPGIQKNRLGLKEIDLFVFNIFSIKTQTYFSHYQVEEMCKSLGLKMVPLDSKFIFNHTIEQLLQMANGKYEGTNNRREGIVIRPEKEMQSKVIGGRMSFKVLSNDYLLKDED